MKRKQASIKKAMSIMLATTLSTSILPVSKMVFASNNNRLGEGVYIEKEKNVDLKLKNKGDKEIDSKEGFLGEKKIEYYEGLEKISMEYPDASGETMVIMVNDKNPKDVAYIDQVSVSDGNLDIYPKHLQQGVYTIYTGKVGGDGFVKQAKVHARSSISSVKQKAFEGTAKIDGNDLTVGSILTANFETKLEKTDYSYQWLRGSVDIDGATKETYTLTKEDLDKDIKVKVVSDGIKSDYYGEVVSEAKNIPAIAPDKPKIESTVDGNSITLNWEKPQSNSSEIEEYILTKDEEEPLELAKEMTEYPFRELELGRKYTFKLKAVNAAGESEESIIEVELEKPPVEEDKSVDTTKPSSPENSSDTLVPNSSDNSSNVGNTSNTIGSITDLTNNLGQSSKLDSKTQIKPETNKQKPKKSETNNQKVLESKKTITSKDSNKSSMGEKITKTEVKNGDKIITLVKIPASIIDSNKTIEIPVSDISVSKDGKNVQTIKIDLEKDAKVNIKIPVKNATLGTVATILQDDGTKKVVSKTNKDETGIILTISSSTEIQIVENTKQFKDTDNHWGKDYVDFVSSRELFTGTGKERFSPDNLATRGMLVTVLHRLEGKPKYSENNTFSDVGKDSWYNDSVSWATEKGFISGYNDDTFGPNDVITREQIALLLYNIVGSPKASQQLDFKDVDMISDWAKDAMTWAVSKGIFTGYDDNMLHPKQGASRAETSTVLMKFIESMIK